MSEEELLKLRMMKRLQRELTKRAVEREERRTDPKEVFKANLTSDGARMFQQAAEQYPDIAEKIAEAVGRLYMAGRLDGKLDAEAVYGIFYEMGFPIRLQTKIVYKKRGEVKSISELIKGEG